MPTTDTKRPSRNSDAVREAVADALMPSILRYLGDSQNGDERDAILKTLTLCHDWDGYELVRELESRCYWDGDRELVEIMDSADVHRTRIHGELVKQWVKDFDIKPQFAIGDRVRYREHEGIIANIYEKKASYIVSVPSLGHVGHLPEPEHFVNRTIGFYADFEDVTRAS